MMFLSGGSRQGVGEEEEGRLGVSILALRKVNLPNCVLTLIFLCKVISVNGLDVCNLK